MRENGGKSNLDRNINCFNKLIRVSSNQYLRVDTELPFVMYPFLVARLKSPDVRRTQRRYAHKRTSSSPDIPVSLYPVSVLLQLAAL